MAEQTNERTNERINTREILNLNTSLCQNQVEFL